MSATWTLTLRSLQHWQRRPGLVAVGLFFPVLLVLMFGYLLGAGIAIPGGGDYIDYLLPGMFVITMFFGIEATMMAVATDAAAGVTDRFRSMPMKRYAVVAGRSVADMLNATLGLFVIIGCGLLVGWEWTEGIAGAAAAVGLLLLLRLAVIWIGIYLGLVAGDAQAVAAVQILVWPVAALSSVIAPTEPMPDWLGTLAEWNPLSATAAAVRDLFGNPGTAGDSWIVSHAVLMAVVWPLLLLAVFVPLAVARWRDLGD